MFFPRSRKPRPGDEALLGWKLGAFFAGAVLWLAGAVIDSDLLVGLAIVVLLAGLFSSVLRPRAGEVEEGDADADREAGLEER